MLESKPAKPSYLRALFVTAIIGVPFAYELSRSWTKASPLLWYVATPLIIALVAALLYTRTLSDWRTNAFMDLNKVDRRADVSLPRTWRGQ
jgi:hypothetical protein